MNTLLDKISGFATSHRLLILLGVLAVTACFATGMSRIEGKVLIEELLPYEHPYCKIMSQFSETFGSGGSSVGIVLRARSGDIFRKSVLTKIQFIDHEVSGWEEVYRSLTLSLASRSMKTVRPVEGGEIRVQHLMWPGLPETKDDLEQLRNDVFSDPMLNGTFVSADGTAALVLTQFKENHSYERSFNRLRTLAERFTDEETQVHLVGFPVLMGWIYACKGEMVALMLLSVFLMISMLIFFFRSFAGLAAPLLFAILTTLMGLGFIGFLGMNFSPLLYVLAFLVFARVVSHSVQITHRYLELLGDCGCRETACRETIRSMLIPNGAGVVTDAAGFFILILIAIPLMQITAVAMTFWLLTVGMCGIVVPILCSYTPQGKAEQKEGGSASSLLDRIPLQVGRFSMQRGRRIVILATTLALAFCILQSMKLEVGDPTPGSPLLWENHPYNRDQALVDRTFNVSSEDFILYYAGEEQSVYDPLVLGTFDRFKRHMQKRLPDIYRSSDSFIGMLEAINYVMHDGDVLWRELPPEEEKLTSLIGWSREQVDGYTMARYFDHAMSKSQITLFFSDHTSESLRRIQQEANRFFQEVSLELPRGRFYLAGGRIGMEAATNEAMLHTHATVDGLVLAAMFLLCALFYRSLCAALMLTLPLVLANLAAYAFMAMSGIGLSINTLPIAAVGVGVGIDFSIYLYSRCIEELSIYGQESAEALRKRLPDAILTSLATSGEAVVLTGLTMILPISLWYFLSEMKFQAQTGILLAVILGANMVMALTLHPLMLHVFRPAFLIRLASARKRILI